LCCPEKKFWTKQKNHNPPLQVKWSVPYLLNQIKTKFGLHGPWVVPFKSWKPSRWRPLLKREISLIVLLLYFKSKWALILNAATWHGVVQHIFWGFFFSKFIWLGILWTKKILWKYFSSWVSIFVVWLKITSSWIRKFVDFVFVPK
jgi:hypothetical protein